MLFLFKFDKNLLKIIKHCKKPGQVFHVPYYPDKKCEPCLYLVHDAGVYLISGCEESLPVKKGESKQVVTYAEGQGPESYLGGDDFVVEVPLSWFHEAIVEKARHISLEVTATEVRWRRDI